MLCALFQQYRLHALHFSIHKRFIKPSSSASSPEPAPQRLSFCKPAMPYSPWYSPQKLLDGSQRTGDSLAQYLAAMHQGGI